MIITTRPDATDDQIDAIRERVESYGFRTCAYRHGTGTLIGALGDSMGWPVNEIATLAGVAAVDEWPDAYRLAGRALMPDDKRTAVRIAEGSAGLVGGSALAVIAGPCAVESRDMLEETARSVRRAGATALRGGAFKPRTSPYAFQGLGVEALRLLADVRRETGLPVVTEVLDPRHVDLVAEHADVLQVGARNMQNYPLLAELGRIARPVLLKRGMGSTITEWLLAAEYILARGNGAVILCERGIRTFETSTRNTLDVGAVAVLRRETHLPIVVDPSHAAGRADLVPALAYAGIAAGADGLLIEVHSRPETARSDGEQSLSTAAFAELMLGVDAFARAAGRTLAGSMLIADREAA